MEKYKDLELLNKVSKDLYYEVSHLIQLFLLVISEEKNNVIKHAFLESLLIHARNIFYFLYSVEPKNDDVIIEHYISNSKDWEQFRATELKKDIFKNFRRRVAKEIAHLTYSRGKKTEENKYWDIRFVLHLIKGIDKFIKLAPEELLHKDWQNYEALKVKLFANIDRQFNVYAHSTH